MPQWRITDGDYYIDPSGSDLNPGTQAAPFASLGRVWNFISNQKIVVGAGLYIETGAFINGNRYHADQNGTVVIDQAGLLKSTLNFALQQYEWHGFVWRNFNKNFPVFYPNFNQTVEWLDCKFFNNTYPWAGTPQGTLTHTRFTRCLFVNNNMIPTDPLLNNRYIITNCTFINTNLRVREWIQFDDSHLDINSSLTADEPGQAREIRGARSNINGTLNDASTGLVDVDLATFKLNSTLMDTCIDADGELNQRSFIDSDVVDVTVSQYSPMLNLNGGDYAGYSRYGISVNANDDAFDINGSAVLLSGSVNKVGSTYELTANNTHATIETDVLTIYGADSRVLTRLLAQGFINPRLQVFDDDNTTFYDNPNYHSLEMKWSDTADIYPPSTTLSGNAWYKFRWGEKPQYDPVNDVGSGSPNFDPLNAQNIKTKFIKLRVTFRNNGVT